MAEKVLKLYKNLGETPLECIESFKSDNPEYKDLPMTYAGRLDPMAEGLLIVLVGEERKKKDEYLGLSKEYVFEVLFGFMTDTYDLLGLPKASETKDANFDKFLGKRIQKYPPFSSKTIDGVPLFEKTRSGEEFDLPEKEVEVFEIKVQEERTISKKDLLEEILRKIDLVKGDFRQEEIIKAWKDILGKDKREEFKIVKVKTSCSSGTYVRSICNEVGACAFSIKREKVGQFKI